MPTFIKKPDTVEAVQWNKDGDHPAVIETPGLKQSDGMCDRCDKGHALHGTMLVGWGLDKVVCPGDWIVQDSDRLRPPFLIRQADFSNLYQPEDGETAW